MRHVIITILSVFVAMTAFAQGNGSIYIEDFEVAPDSTVSVQVMLTNAVPTHGLQFKMTLPDGLVLEEAELSKHSRRLKMNLAKNKNDDNWIVAVYSMDQTTYPPDTAPVLTLTLTAEPEFAGGNIIIKKSQGTDDEFATIYYNDSTTTVTCASGL